MIRILGTCVTALIEVSIFRSVLFDWLRLARAQSLRYSSPIALFIQVESFSQIDLTIVLIVSAIRPFAICSEAWRFPPSTALSDLT